MHLGVFDHSHSEGGVPANVNGKQEPADHPWGSTSSWRCERRPARAVPVVDISTCRAVPTLRPQMPPHPRRRSRQPPAQNRPSQHGGN
jgi:hypothetical protein